jgi:hypothetical protein
MRLALVLFAVLLVAANAQVSIFELFIARLPLSTIALPP